MEEATNPYTPPRLRSIVNFASLGRWICNATYPVMVWQLGHRPIMGPPMALDWLRRTRRNSLPPSRAARGFLRHKFSSVKPGRQSRHRAIWWQDSMLTILKRLARSSGLPAVDSFTCRVPLSKSSGTAGHDVRRSRQTAVSPAPSEWARDLYR